MHSLVPSWLEVRVLPSSVCVVCQSGYEETLKKFGQGVIEIYAPVGGRVSFVFVMAFVDGCMRESCQSVGCTWDSHMPLKSNKIRD